MNKRMTWAHVNIDCEWTKVIFRDEFSFIVNNF